MVRSELIERILINNPSLRERDVRRIINAIFQKVSDTLCSGGRVELRGFGTFSIKKWDKRISRNPRTGLQIDVDRSWTISFKASKDLKQAINGQ